ncbi:hypothetical protein [Paenibacillus sp. GP183]|uniref:hypothetical protein n=1 Tax=Paenibacillus sp. GP183 TaxID=1882751 RepID=UPI0008948665|nr:hypothetical protein [Paenibacillus sp. GP183]SED06919.1 hypothetical protein SAMN05443246_5571 [Paenibacillus sp. GP183]
MKEETERLQLEAKLSEMLKDQYFESDDRRVRFHVKKHVLLYIYVGKIRYDSFEAALAKESFTKKEYGAIQAIQEVIAKKSKIINRDIVSPAYSREFKDTSLENKAMEEAKAPAQQSRLPQTDDSPKVLKSTVPVPRKGENHKSAVAVRNTDPIAAGQVQNALTSKAPEEAISDSKMNSIKIEVTRASREMQSNRSERPFTELEKAFGYASFIYWLNAYHRMLSNNDPGVREYCEACNVSGRMAAISLMEHLYQEHEFVQGISRYVPNFNRVKEIELAHLTGTANSLSFDPYWQNCTLRAAIMICRQLTYNFTGVLGKMDFRIPKDMTLDELTIAMDQWLNEVLNA